MSQVKINNQWLVCARCGRTYPMSHIVVAARRRNQPWTLVVHDFEREGCHVLLEYCDKG